MLSIFPCAYWPCVYLLWKNVYFDALPIFKKVNLLFERERERERERESMCMCEQGRSRQRGGERILSRLHAASTEPDVGLKLMDCEVMT